MAFADLVLAFGDLEQVISNLTETALQCMIIMKMVLIKYSGTLRETIMMATNELMEDAFSQSAEKKIYLFYITVAKKFFKVPCIFAICATTAYHWMPMQAQIYAALTNQTVPMLLPYRTHVPIELTDLTTYIFIWIYQLPVIYLNTFQIPGVSLGITLVLNASGHLAILKTRIRRIERINGVVNVQVELVDSIRRYLQIARYVKLINKSFRIILLEEVVIMTVCTALGCYTLLVYSDLSNGIYFMVFIVYMVGMLLPLYGYCFVGEYLITQSEHVHDAYYHCDWLNLSLSVRKSLILCLIGTKNPLQLTAGGFYRFSLGGFTTIIKTAMAYFSMLRTLAL
ncbi:odorant receptor 43a-like [Fopius arisanus]|uniref:Odorant receptor 43a-like n=1 Tax=Fopius arisanus TaxID=64838 RepID=A0A9R1SXG4_9HYME|nr:PREDICTED: odorant receptor 43a-like [Fopius arisanus]